VNEQLLNEMFNGSGLFGPLDLGGVEAAGPPEVSWCEENYFHPAEHNDLIEHVAGLRMNGTSMQRVRRRGLPAAWITVRRTVRLLTTRGGAK
jgi:hypothetical protein